MKPHPMAPKFNIEENVDITNVIFIDDEWIYNQGLDLYQFVGLTDILISDVSSIIFDYMLLDQPIVCISEDFEEYKNNRGYFFEDIEDKIPTKVLKSQIELFDYVDILLKTGVDVYQDKRITLKEYFFKYLDDQSTKRLLDLILKIK